MDYEPTIGLEIHVELKTHTKMFCDCLNDPDLPTGQAGETRPNANVCSVCMAHPGTLPVINETAIHTLVKVGLALNCAVARFSKFDRKNYFYPDLPKGYQISQYDLPLCFDGHLDIGDKSVRIERIHMEEDTGRLQHASDGKHSLVDYNRAGVPLMELVTKPDITDPTDIEKFAKELRLLLRYLDASDADMEKGQMRIEVNISVKRKAKSEKEGPLGTKVEIKNINSIGAAVRAAQYEFKRQSAVLEAGETIIQETRGWDENKGITFSQRIKEGSADYRYFPEPDLPPLTFTDEQIEKLRGALPELPAMRRARFAKEYGLSAAQCEVFTISKNLGDFFEEVSSELGDKNLNTLAANYIITEQPNNVTAENFAELIKKIANKELSSTSAKLVLNDMVSNGEDPDVIMQKRDLGQISDAGMLMDAIDAVILKNTKSVEDYKKGKIEVLKFLVGQVMKETRGKANPEVVMSVLKQKLT